MRFVPAGRRARRVSLGALVALLAAPAASLGDPSGARADTESSSAAPPATTTHEAQLATGSEARKVRLLQKALGIRIDGIYGPETEHAVIAYQASRNLAVDGIVGPETRAALAGHAPAGVSSRAGQPDPGRRTAGIAIATDGRSRHAVPAAAERDHGSRAGVTPTRPQGRRSVHTGGKPTSITHGEGVLTPRSVGGSSGFSAFAMCVARLESGINWRIDTGNGYEGAFQWLHSSWISMGGGRFAPRAIEATPAEQVQIFEENVATDPGAWPTTVPACMHLRSTGLRGMPAASGQSAPGTAGGGRRL